MANASLCSGFLPGPIRSALERDSWRTRPPPPPHLGWLSFINMMHVCTGGISSAPRERSSSLCYFKKAVYSAVWKQAASAERSGVGLSIPPLRRSSGFGCRYEAPPVLNSSVRSVSRETERRGKSGAAQCQRQLLGKKREASAFLLCFIF